MRGHIYWRGFWLDLRTMLRGSVTNDRGVWSGLTIRCLISQVFRIKKRRRCRGDAHARDNSDNGRSVSPQRYSAQILRGSRAMKMRFVILAAVTMTALTSGISATAVAEMLATNQGITRQQDRKSVV